MHDFFWVLQLASKVVRIFSKFVEEGTYIEVWKYETIFLLREDVQGQVLEINKYPL